ncbi:Putative ribonuclease H protein At1g65750 [Linum perenne]
MREELRGVIEGMKMAWNKGIRILRIQTDSKAAVDLLSDSHNRNTQHASLIEQFSELSAREWQVFIHHIYHEPNFAADLLASLGHGFEFGVHTFDLPDVSLQYWLRFDLVGSCTHCLIINHT